MRASWPLEVHGMPQDTHLTTVRCLIDGDSRKIWINKQVREIRLYGAEVVTTNAVATENTGGNRKSLRE